MEEGESYLDKLFKSKEAKYLTGIVVLAIVIRLIYFSVNKAVWWDAADYLVWAKMIGKSLDINYVFNPRRPFLLPLLWGLLYKIGFGEIALRVTEFFFSVIAVIATYFVGKIMYNKKIGLIASLLMSVFWLHLFFTSRLLTSVPALAFWLLAVYCFWRGYVKKDKSKFLWLAGLFLGLSILTRAAASMMVGVILLFLLLGGGNKFKFLKNKQLWIGLVVFILVLSPFFILVQVTQGDAIGKISGVEEGRFSNAMGFAGIPQYIKFLPTYFTWPLLILFIIGLYAFVNLFMGYDLFWKGKLKAKNDFFLFWWMIVPFLFYSLMVDHMEPRYLMFIFPAAFILVAKGAIWLYDALKKYKKELAMVVVGLILLIGVGMQLSHANDMIKNKADSYVQLNLAGEWIKERSSPGDVIICRSTYQMMYYAERSVYDFGSTEEGFEELLVEVNPRYMVLSALEHHNEWMYSYPARHNGTWVPVQAYFVDESNQQPILVIYEKN